MAVLIAGLLMSGCAHDGDLEPRAKFTRVFTPQMPSFMIGPAAAFFTNTAGFSAKLVVQADPAFPQPGPVEGELLGRGSKLLFAPRQIDTGEKVTPAKGFTYVWDMASASGFVLSEALQAYAPVSSSLRVTNVVEAAGAGAAHSVTVQMNDGSQNVYRLIRDPKNGFPESIAALNPPATLTLSKTRFQAPPLDLFAPPSGFSRYQSPEALADEIAARQHSLRRGGGGLTGEN
jgi:hypothetical protein